MRQSRFVKFGLLVLVAVVVIFACAKKSTIVLFAQSVPATVHPTWDPNPTSDNVTRYIVTTNGVAVSVPASSCTATCSSTATVNAFGAQSTTVIAVNQKISTDSGSEQFSAPASINWTLSQSADRPTGATVKQ